MKPKLRKILREILLWALALAIAVPSVFVVSPSDTAQAAVAALSSNGVLFYGDAGAAGVMRAAEFTAPATYATEISGITGSASNILHVASKTAPTREEIMIGSLRVNGTLQVESCTTACNANGDFTNHWSHASVSGTQDCDTTATLSTCFQSFDIGYEALNGKAMVVYAGDGADGGTVPDADTMYYAEWDGSAWAPNTTPGTPGTSNDIDLGGASTAGTPQWVRFIPAGDRLDKDRSNRGMMIVADDALDLWPCYWDGSTWDCATTALETSLENCDGARCFDGAWSSNTVFILTYYESADAVNDIEYRTYTVGTGWGSETQLTTIAGAGQWLVADADPTSSRVYVAEGDDGADTAGLVWRADNATDGWTVCASGGCPEGVTETQLGGAQIGGQFERFSGEGLHLFNNNVNGATQGNMYMTYTPASTWGTATLTGITPTDDHMSTKAVASPNSDDIMIMAGDVDCDWDAVLWSGAGVETVGSNLETSLASTNGDCANTVPEDGMGVGYGYDFAWKMYTPWQRNWRWYDGEDAGGDEPSVPTAALAAENTAITGVLNSGDPLRLRINYAERGRSVSETNTRKKLQYTSGCNPNTALETTCTWTDVDDIGGSGAWRYVDITCTATDCADDTVLTGTVLTGSSTCSAGLGCGTWVMDKDAASPNGDHTSQATADTVQELEFVIDPNTATPGTTYYFRVYNTLVSSDGQDTPIYREQDADDCGGGSAACTYPSLTMFKTDQFSYRWRDDDGSESGATNLQSENIGHTGQVKNDNIRLRTLVHTTGGTSTSYNYRLEWAARVGATCDTDESYAAVPDVATTEHFDMVLTSQYADGDATTNVSGLLTDPGGSPTFVAGDLVESTSNQTGAITLTDNQFTENEYVFQANNNGTASGNYCFRVTNAGTALTTYTNYAALQLASEGPTTDEVMRHGNWFTAAGVEQYFFWAN